MRTHHGKDTINIGSVSAFLGNDYLYCLNHGKDFVPNVTYLCYEAGTASSELSYIIAQQTPHDSENPRDSETDLIANAVWVMIGEGHTETPPLLGTAELNDLLARATLAASIKASGNISITGPQSPVIESADGKYGPFKITYPSHNNKVFAVTSGGAPIPDDALVIKVNGKTLTNIPESGKEFYLTENDGIKHGEKNEIEVFYNGYRVAPSNYAKFTPERAISRKAYCIKCGGTFTYRSVGFCVGNVAYKVPPKEQWYVDPINSEGHRDEECDGSIQNGSINFLNTVHYQDDYQNLIYLTPMYNSVHESKKFEFWAGKPEIEINIDKVDTSNKVVPGVTFEVSVVNGVAKDGTNSITTGNDGKASITIKPNKGATQVKVILTETKAPANYIKYKSPIELIYDWDNSNKQWKLTT
ncbi:prealbumin-like fold domain-containing protein, partial [Methanobrevibacter smithii]|uniref:prealbumin-like fold domain-containing protein n=1 Tax=Methanobrevibacter smithii TaxID=2173 RepID=UPI0038515533